MPKSPKTPKKSSVANSERTILLAGEVDEDIAGEFLAALMRLDETDGLITVRILSHGGCSGSGFAIYDAIRLARNDVRTEVFGCAESIAALVFQAGDTRAMAPSATLRLHRGSISNGDRSSTGRDLQQLADDILDTDRRYMCVFELRSGKRHELVRRWCDDSLVFGADEALRCGLADTVLGVE